MFFVVFIVLCALIALEYCVWSSDVVFEATIPLLVVCCFHCFMCSHCVRVLCWVIGCGA